ncbi:MAG: monovalent cation/H+ antiporter complex subunit F [Planctomycetota bacterium]
MTRRLLQLAAFAMLVLVLHAAPDSMLTWDAAAAPDAAATTDAYGSTDDVMLTEAVTRSPLRTPIIIACGVGFIVLIIGLVLCIIRTLLGPHVADRVVATDLITIHITALVVMLTIRLGKTEYYDIILVVSLISFAATIGFAQYIAARTEDEASQARRQAEHDIDHAHDPNPDATPTTDAAQPHATP